VAANADADREAAEKAAAVASLTAPKALAAAVEQTHEVSGWRAALLAPYEVRFARLIHILFFLFFIFLTNKICVSKAAVVEQLKEFVVDPLCQEIETEVLIIGIYSFRSLLHSTIL